MTTYNYLEGEESPYLKQHVDNPVDWYPWGEKAFKKAKENEMPIFLSIGYSTCHWCHVMEEESFTDQRVAEILNKNFIAVKVDREERPDIDKLYMEVCKTMTGGGGWPLTIFMTPDKKPFHATTYIPKNDKYGRKGLFTILPEIIDLWENKRDRIEHLSNNIISQIKAQEDSNEVNLTENILTDTVSILERSFDEKFGGFGNEPKFPTPHYLLFLLRYWDNYEYSKSINMVLKTLEEMRSGGIYDQIGFGFHRYSTDQEWQTPHFEKMLYDQALLIYTYIEAYQVTDKKIYRDTAKEVIKYLKRDMLSKTGCFYAAEDADSDGVEGKYYLWKSDELKKILNSKEFEIIKKIFNIERSNHINLTLKDIDNYDKIPEIKEILFQYREKRNHPGKDNKILTDWNGLIIAALAKAGFVSRYPQRNMDG
ncbi:MAG: thioredoxin domain-containing protein [Halanaerobiales bacterium]